MPVTEQRAKALWKAQGYESGYWWGSITGAVAAVGTAAVFTSIAAVTAPVIIGGAAVAGVGYLVGGTVGGAIGASRGETAAENKVVLEPNASEEEIRSDAASKGGVGGGIAVGYAASSPAMQKVPGVLDKKIAEALTCVEETHVIKLVGTAAGIATGSSLVGEYLHHNDDAVPM